MMIVRYASTNIEACTKNNNTRKAFFLNNFISNTTKRKPGKPNLALRVGFHTDNTIISIALRMSTKLR